MTQPQFSPTAEQFTEAFVEQIVTAIQLVPSHHAGGMSFEGVDLLLQSRIGTSRVARTQLLSCLTALRLVSEIDGVLGRSVSGDRLRREIRGSGSLPVAVAILRSGFVADQIRSLRPLLRLTDTGYACGRSAAQAVAPQLVGLLARLPDVTVAGEIALGSEAGIELDSVWNELPPSGRIDWTELDKRRKAIGDRAELYSIQLERSSGAGAIQKIRWVSRDDDSLGYDIEIDGPPRRHIEVKGSSGREVVFFLSANELSVAREHGERYEIHFWGELNLAQDPVEEYRTLTERGYPLRLADPAVALAQPPWELVPTQYRARRQTD